MTGFERRELEWRERLLKRQLGPLLYSYRALSEPESKEARKGNCVSLLECPKH